MMLAMIIAGLLHAAVTLALIAALFAPSVQAYRHDTRGVSVVARGVPMAHLDGAIVPTSPPPPELRLDSQDMCAVVEGRVWGRVSFVDGGGNAVRLAVQQRDGGRCRVDVHPVHALWLPVVSYGAD